MKTRELTHVEPRIWVVGRFPQNCRVSCIQDRLQSMYLFIVGKWAFYSKKLFLQQSVRSSSKVCKSLLLPSSGEEAAEEASSRPS